MTTGRYTVMHADLSGTEGEVATFPTLWRALCRRDFEQATHRRDSHCFRVVDSEDAERGELGWDDLEVSHA